MIGPAHAADHLEPPLTITVAALVDTLGRTQLLSPKQQGELVHTLSGRFVEARALARELIGRQWLTPYQANQLLQGRCKELVLGPYILLERLGEGGTGQVFKARHRKMGRLTAVKLIRRHLVADAEAVGRFLREIEVVSRMSHPNVVHAYDAGLVSGTHFLAMEYVDGTDLGRLVKESGPLPVEPACEYIRQAALGLQHAHEKGLVHRDIKPHNLLLSKAGSIGTATVKVADLGLARFRRTVSEEATAILGGTLENGTLTPENAVLIGTADYLAPEQAVNFHEADIRADIYSLGCTFYYLLAGRPPFVGTLAEKLLKHQQAEPAAIAEVRPDLPPWVAQVLRRMMMKRPEDRFQAPAEVAQALAPGRESGAAHLPRRKPSRRRWLRWPAGAALLGAGGGLAILMRPSGPVPQATGPGGRSGELVRFSARELGPLTADSDVICVAFSPDSKGLLAGTYQSGIHVWERTGTQWLSSYKRTQTPRKPVAQLAFRPDGKLLIVCKEYGTDRHITTSSVRLWDLEGGGERLLYEKKEGDSALLGMAVSPDGQTAAAFSDGEVNPEVKLYDLNTFAEKPPGLRVTSTKPKSSLTFLRFSEDSATLAAAFSVGKDLTNVELWNVNTRKALTSFRMNGQTGEFTGLAFSPDGKALAVSRKANDDSLKLWNVANGTLIRQLGGLRPAFADDRVFASVSRASKSGESILRIWDLSNFRLLLSQRTNRNVNHGLAFSPDGRTLVAWKGNEIHLWEVRGDR